MPMMPSPMDIQAMANQALVWVVYAAGFGAMVCVGWAIFPQPSMPLPGFIGEPDDMGSGGGARINRRTRALKRFFAYIGKFLVRKEEQLGEMAKPRLLYTGSTMTVVEFYGLRVFCAVGSVVVALVLLREFRSLPPASVVIAAVIGFLGPGLWLKSRIAARRRAIMHLLPEVVDLLSLCIGAGLDFLMSLNKVVTLKKLTKEPFIEELALALQEIKFGKRRMDALKAMAKRINLPEISSFVRTITQADRMGTPIGEVLAVHSEDVRTERLLRAEREALKAPIKILLPLIFFIMPCVAIVVGSPIFIQFMTQSPFGKK